MLSIKAALVMTVVMGVVIFLCRLFPFLVFRNRDNSGGPKKGMDSFLTMVERVVPPVAMTVLAFNSIGAPVKEDLHLGIPMLAASCFTVLVHLWKRNVLISIVGGTLLYMVLCRIIIQ